MKKVDLKKVWWDLKKVSALWSVRFRVSPLERFCYKEFVRDKTFYPS